MIRDENYIQIAGWMLNELGLKGNELIIYALIHGFCQDGKNTYHGGLTYIADWTNSTKQGVIKALKSLIDKKLIVKNLIKVDNGVQYCEYFTLKSRGVKQSLPSDRSTKFNAIQNKSGKQSLPPVKQSLPPRSTEFNATGKQSLPNNNILNSSLKNSSSPSLFENFENEIKNGKAEEEKETGIKKIIQDIFGNSNALTPDFEKRLCDIFKKNSLENESFGPYLKYVWQLCEKKHPENMSAYFFRSALNDMTVMNFSLSQKNAAREEKENLFRCPVCGELHQTWERCPKCGLEIFERNDADACEIRKKELSLSDSQREELSRELLNLCKKYLGDNSPSRFAKQESEKMELYRKYGLISEDFSENEIRSGA